MERINFKNGQAPYINDTNLNKMQDNIENSFLDTLESTSTKDALSANQGRVLNEKIENANTYSTEEINTGKTWIDGKDIYRRYITFTVGTSTNVWNQLANFDFETIVHNETFIKKRNCCI